MIPPAAGSALEMPMLAANEAVSTCDRSETFRSNGCRPACHHGWRPIKTNQSMMRYSGGPKPATGGFSDDRNRRLEACMHTAHMQLGMSFDKEGSSFVVDFRVQPNGHTCSCLNNTKWHIDRLGMPISIPFGIRLCLTQGQRNADRNSIHPGFN